MSPTLEDREGMAYHDGYDEGLADGRHEGTQAGFEAGYKRAWRDAQLVAKGWGWVRGLPALNQEPEIPPVYS